ncbi:F0F1 ATP synthase subunit B [Rhizobiales bacterium RZME27]|uniref:ATP synthase subunit b n=2 Tax=Endobacterium cereale TaxID=2663029 RepID=A0A6A8A8S9_9HYPH|nr:F0F1 ATP synthase subunit B [Endobacterium cereale]
MLVTPAHAQTAPDATQTPVAPGAAPAGEVHTETGVAHDGAHAGGVFPPFDSAHFASQLLWLVITFGVFFLLIQKVLGPRLAGILSDRHDRIAADLSEANRLQAEADAAVETYEKELAAARAKGAGIADAAREAAKTKAANDRAAIEAELAEKLKAAEASIGEIKAKAFANVGDIASETASAIVDQLIGGKATDAEIKTAVAAAKQGA